jgi:hypothetical protein
MGVQMTDYPAAGIAPASPVPATRLAALAVLPDPEGEQHARALTGRGHPGGAPGPVPFDPHRAG